MEATELFDFHVIDFFKNVIRGHGGRSLAEAPRRFARLLGALAFQRRQARTRRTAAREGRTVPPILIASITRRCNLDCVGCYAKILRPGTSMPLPSPKDAHSVPAELSDERFMDLFGEALDLGVGTIMLAGGEPLLRRSLLKRAAALPGVLMPVFTNGTLFDEECLDLFSSGGLVPVFSIEGEVQATEARRGSGIHEAVLKNAAALRARGALFGFSLTLTSRNVDLVISRPFLEGLAALGPALVFMIEYVPAAPGTESLVLSDAQKARLRELERFEGLSYRVVQLPGDEASYGGCMAAGRGFIHLAPDGRVEACPFAPFSDSGAATASLAEALDSPLMRAIRERHAELTETKGGCALWNKSGWIASIGSCANRSEFPETAREAASAISA